MTTPNLVQQLLDATHQLKATMTGKLIRTDDAEYDDLRRVWNGAIDKRPGLIAMSETTEDVIAAVNFARENNVLLSVRGGGHNVAGSAVADGGIVIDLSNINQVAVDPTTQTVRAGGGALIGDVDAATTAHNLAVPLGVVSETGIAGLTLGGGLGWMRRKYGLSCDNLIAAQVVTADGRLITASADENPDLLWGLRGGGSNFGIVTEFTYAAYPIGPEVQFNVVFYPYHQAKSVLQQFHQFSQSAPDEISAFAILGFLPALEGIPAHHHGEPMVLVVAMYTGDPATGAQAMQPLREFGDPIVDLSGPTPYMNVQTFFDEDYPKYEMRYYWKGLHLDTLSEGLIDDVLELNLQAPSKHSTIDIWMLGGMMSRISPETSAYATRNSAYLLNIEANWAEAAEDDVNIRWARTLYAAMERYSDGTQYFNFPGFYEQNDHNVRQSLGGNYERAVALKTKYDPNNLFVLNHNIKPQS